eukprot:scaffold47962_cov36-Cyclotella_meneghiniana.AAC.4
MTAGEVRRRKNKQQPVNETSIAAVDEYNKNGERQHPMNHRTSTTFTHSRYDEYAWFVVFLLAVTYFIVTRSGGGNRNGLLSKFSEPYQVIDTSIVVGVSDNDNDRIKNEDVLRGIFYIQKASMSLLRPLEVIISSPPDFSHNNTTKVCSSAEASCSSTFIDPGQNSGYETPFLSHVLSSTWVHDSELGRGYLLIADTGRSGRIWRWEVGGGPITIGRSLHMENSGCRSGLWVDGGKCPGNLFNVKDTEKVEEQDHASIDRNELPSLMGTASIITELQRDAERSTEGKNLVVAEWGERRIIRVEGETGARTPLVTMLPSPDSNGLRRLYRPNHLMYTPFGDLLFSDSYNGSDDRSKPVAAIYRLRDAVHVPAIPVEQSRDAHNWTHTTANGQMESDSIDTIFQIDGWIDGMALSGSDHSTLFVSVVTESESGWTKRIYKLTLGSDDYDDNDQSKQASASRDKAAHNELFYSIASNECEYSNKSHRLFIGSKLAIDEHGTLYSVACPSSLVLLSHHDGHVIGKLILDADDYHSLAISSVNFGEDGYIYLTTSEKLMRIQARVKGRSIPTNMVVPSSKIGRRDKRDKQ